MVSRGAQVRPEEIAVISDYLASTFGTDAPATDTGLKQAGVGPASSSQVSGKYSPAIPEGPGRVLVLSSCTDCHGLNKITEQRKDERGWRAAVNDMVRLGAKMKPAEVEAVVSYLALNFGPQLGVVGSASTQATGPTRPADLSRMLPDGEGKGLILATCVQCHGLQEIVGQRKDAEGWIRTVQDMVSRGAQITPEEVDLITSYLARRMAR
jgi:mono/diheme cytochrome c family protein